MTHLCRACSSSRVNQILSFSEYPSTGFNLTDIVDFAAFECSDCGLQFLVCDSDQFIWRLQSNSSLRLNEPTAHLDAATDLLTATASSVHNPIFLGFSYKDNHLLSNIQQRGYRTLPANWDILPELMDQTTQLYLLDSLLSDLSFFNGAGSSFLILTKAIEHIFDASIYLRLLTGPSAPQYIYLEISDFTFNTLSNFSLWNERASYFDGNTISILFKRFGYKLIESTHLDFTCCESEHCISSAMEAIPNHILQSSSSSSIFQSAVSVLDDIIKASNSNNIGIFGSGHKGVTLLRDYLPQERQLVCTMEILPRLDPKSLATVHSLSDLVTVNQIFLCLLFPLLQLLG